MLERENETRRAKRQQKFGFLTLAACAHREVRQRLRVYPRLVASGKMGQDHADEEIAKMRAIAAHFDAAAIDERLI